MDTQDISNRQKDYSSRKYSRSPSTDSEEERRRRRRRREREADRGSTRSDRRDDHPRGTRDTYEDKGRHRRRSRSPIDLDPRRQKDHRNLHRRRRDRSRDRRRIKDEDSINSAESETKSALSRRQNGPLPSQAAPFQSNKDPSTALVRTGNEPILEKEKPNLGQTGVLAAASNTITQADGNAIVLKYHEPPEACKPPAKDDWKLFVFKGADIIETINLSTRSCWLIGRELAVVDLAAEHPSISKQHAVIQFKATEKMNEFGDKVRRVKPYLIDLESANGTMMNKDPVDKSRYVELMDKDMIQFGHSTREYVLMLAPRT